MPSFVPYLMGLIAIVVGLRTLFTQEATISIKLWGYGSNSPPSEKNAGYSTSNHTGFIAVLIGIGEIAIGFGIIFKGSAFFI